MLELSLIYKQQAHNFILVFFLKIMILFFLMKPLAVLSPVFIKIEINENLSTGNIIQKHSHENTYTDHDN